jgi:hypothetical protein
MLAFSAASKDEQPDRINMKSSGTECVNISNTFIVFKFVFESTCANICMK